MIYAIINARIYDFVNYIENGYVIFENNIIEVGKMTEYKDEGYIEINAKHSIVMPGLINGHSHIYSTFARGLSLNFNPTNFVEILEQLWWKIDRNLDNEMNYYQGLVSGVDYVLNGVTTLIDHHAYKPSNTNALNCLKEAVVEDVKIRSIFCLETSDRFDVDKCIKENLEFINETSTTFSRGLFGMHAAFTLSEETLTKISKVIKDNPIHIHVAESIMDQEDSLKKYNERVVNRLDRHKLLNKNSIITHALYIDEEEAKLIKKNKCVVALNVTSNMNNSVGLPNYQLLKKHNIKTIIGNDGISMSMASEYQSLYYAMHHFDKTPTLFTFEDLLKIIRDTYSYTKEILDIKIGRIKKDYVADLLIVPYNNPTPINENNIFGHLFFGLFSSFKPKHVFVNGNQIVNDYQVNKELRHKYKYAINSAQKLWDKIEKEG